MPISVVQTAIFPITTAKNNWDVTFSAPITSGNVVAIIARLSTSNRTIGTPTGGGGTFSSVIANNATLWGGLQIWSKVEPNAGVTVYNVAIASLLTAVGSITGYELSGADGATATASGTGVQATTTTSPRMLDTGLDIPTGGIMIGGMGTTTTSNVSWGTMTAAPTNFIPQINSNTGVGQGSHFIGYRTAAGTGVQGTATVTTARAVYGIAAVWSEAPTGGPFPHFTRRKMFGGMTFPRGGI